MPMMPGASLTQVKASSLVKPRSSEELDLKLTAELAEVAPARRRVLEFLGARHVDARQCYSASVVVEELLTNIVTHAYGDSAVGPMRLKVTWFSETVRLVFEDEGPPFDPVAQPEPILPASLGDAPIGGRGISMVRAQAASLSYRRLGEFNRLEVVIK